MPDFQSRRRDLYKGYWKIVDDKKAPPLPIHVDKDPSAWLELFNSKENTKHIWEFFTQTVPLTKNGYDMLDTEFYETFACDKLWARQGGYCRPKGFDDCVNNLSNQVNNDDGSVTYDSRTYREKVTLFPNKTWKSASGKKGVFFCANGMVTLEEKKIRTPDEIGGGDERGSGDDRGGGRRRRSGGGGSSCVDISWVKDDVLTGGKKVKKCMKGTLVGIIQERLKHHGFPNFSKNGNVDSTYGSRTEGEVIKFQKKFDLKDDGIVGKMTLEALLKDKYDLTPVSTSTTTNDFEGGMTDVSTGTSGN